MKTDASLRIALLTHSVRPRGGVVHTLELAEQLRLRGHTVTVIASVEPGERLFREVHVPVSLIPLPVLSGDLVEQVRQRIQALVRELPSVLAYGRFHIVHAQDSLSGNALALLRANSYPTPPWVRTVHHLDHFKDSILNDWQDRAWRHADAVACVSDSWCEHFACALGVTAARMFNGVDLARFHPITRAGAETYSDPAPVGAIDGGADREGRIDPAPAAVEALGLPASTGPVCLLVGGVEERKNTVRLLHAFAQLRREDPAWRDARLVIAGGASMLDHRAARESWISALAAHALTEGPGQPVLRTGPLPDPMLPALMRRASVLAMPSLVEGFGLAAIEALACGTPVLVSRRRPFTEHLADAPGVAWCEPEDVTSIATGLQRAAAMPRLTAIPQVCLDHSWARSAALHEDWYRRTLNAAVPVAAVAEPLY